MTNHSLRCPADLLKYRDVVFGKAAVKLTSPASCRLPSGCVISSLGDAINLSPFNFFSRANFPLSVDFFTDHVQWSVAGVQQICSSTVTFLDYLRLNLHPAIGYPRGRVISSLGGAINLSPFNFFQGPIFRCQLTFSPTTFSGQSHVSNRSAQVP